MVTQSERVTATKAEAKKIKDEKIRKVGFLQSKGLSNGEIADVMDIPESVVRVYGWRN